VLKVDILTTFVSIALKSGSFNHVELRDSFTFIILTTTQRETNLSSLTDMIFSVLL